jgi:outer membrane protein assembly factor BamE (lipoprotein component of BamABCDE complex)
MKPLRPSIRIAVAALLCGAVLACSPVTRLHGYAPLPSQLARIEVGVDTRGSVQRKIGRPGATGVFSDEGWYYSSSVVEHMTYKEPKVVERRVVVITFAPNDVVNGLDVYGLEDGRTINLATGTTPTYGRELTIVEQLLGNLGNIRGENLIEDN